jgi:hypothetical protein
MMSTALAESQGQKRKIISTMLMPAVKRVGEAALRDQAMLACAITALAAERFRLAHKRWPKALDELCPTYLASVPRDPYDGHQLRFAHRDDGLVIYSVGQDGQDDGGEVLAFPEGLGGNWDPGLRLWPPEQRGLPPAPVEQPKEPD